MLNNLFILSATGEVLIEKQWVGKMKRAVCETYWEYASKCKDKSQLSPILVTPKYYMIHIQRFDLTFLTCIQKETSPLLLLELQHRIADILIDYFGSPLTETSIRENFSIVYQVLDEMVDGGFAATTEPNQLKEMIVPPSLAKRMLQNLLVTEFAVKSELPSGAVSKIPWRKSDVKYVTNEIYFDLVEQIDAILDVNNNIINCTVNGEIRCNCRLSGTPDLTLTFNRPNALDDTSLHRCIRINRYQRERVISFVPPDGNFKLLSYKIPGNTQIPIQIKPVISYRNGQGRVQITVTPKFTGDKPIMNCQIILPLPAVTRSTSLSTNVGTVKIDTITQLCTWVIGKVPRDRTPVLEGNISLPVDWVPDEAPTIRADFQVKMFCTSGLKVDGLAIRGVKYKPFKGVRTITQAGKFQVRCE